MDLLALIGFTKAIGYEFKAVKVIFTNATYKLYVKRPGKRTWQKCREVGLNGSRTRLVGPHTAIKLIEEWADNPDYFEFYHKTYMNALKHYNERDPKFILRKEDPNATKMKKALE